MSLPLQPGLWVIDGVHSTVEFTVRHLGISKVRGRFRAFGANVTIGPELASSSLTAEVDLSSVDTGNTDRDGHLRTTDFFDLESHPKLTFRSTMLTDRGDGAYAVNGDLSLNGITHPQELIVQFNGTETYPVDGTLHAGFTATGVLSRSAFGVKFDVPLATGGFAIGDKVNIELDVQLYPST